MEVCKSMFAPQNIISLSSKSRCLKTAFLTGPWKLKAEALAKFPDDARGDAAMSVGEQWWVVV